MAVEVAREWRRYEDLKTGVTIRGWLILSTIAVTPYCGRDRTLTDQPTLWDAILPTELLVLPIELAPMDALLDDAGFVR